VTGAGESEDVWAFAQHRWRQGEVALAIGVFFWACAIVLIFIDVPSSWIALAGGGAFSALGFGIWEHSLKLQDQANAMLVVAMWRETLQ
jgi:hypothetical protein